MMKSRIHIGWWGFWLFPLLLLAACEPEKDAGGEDGLGLESSGRIYISAGKMLSGLSTKAGEASVYAPALEGICRADRIDVMLYATQSARIDVCPDEDRYDYESTFSTDNLHIADRDRWGEVAVSSENNGTALTGGIFKHIMFSALAYTEADAASFMVDRDGTDRTSTSLRLASAQSQTPELYFGKVRVSGEDECCHLSYNEDLNGKAVTGHLYRIVGQFNLNVSEIPDDYVRSVALYASYYPKRVGLYGTHGADYPVSAVTDPAHTSGEDLVLLDSAVVGEGNASLSSFMLPSEVGIHLYLQVNYTKYIDVDSVLSRRYELVPGQSFYLPASEASAYSVSADLMNGNQAYVYDSRNGKGCFYSYSNVRVNLHGDYENIVAETGEANVTIEVEPNFEEEHDFEII